MRAELAGVFPLTAGIALLNHASFGQATCRSLEHAAAIRRELEADPLLALDRELPIRLEAIAASTRRWLGLTAGELALTPNATAAAAAVAASCGLRRGATVAVLCTEYPSVMRGWEVAAERTGARCVHVPVTLPLTGAEELIGQLDARLPDRVDVLQVSLITSSSAIRMPLRALGAWAAARDAVLIVDAAHAAGHVEFAAELLGCGAAVAYGDLHKWLPIPRSAGFLWTAPGCPFEVRPAEVSLSWDATALAARFAWPGTFDPTPRLCLPDGIAQWTAWSHSGALARAAALSQAATAALAGAGAIPTCAPELRPPRLQAVMLPGVAVERLVAAADARGVRVWVGTAPGAAGAVLRLATHVYNDGGDVDRVLEAVSAA